MNSTVDFLKDQHSVNFFTLGYVTVAVYVSLLLEHLASLLQEVELIWKAPINIMGLCILLYRYATIAGLTAGMKLFWRLSVHSTIMDLAFCKRATTVSCTLCIVSVGIADALVMLRVSVLWGRQRSILVTILVAFLVTYVTAVICLAIGTTKLVEHITLVKNYCIPMAVTPPVNIGVWIPGMAFDIVVLSMIILNACERPRTQDTALTSALYKDGIAYFLILAGLRAANLFLTIFSSYYLLGIGVAWALSAVTFSRFIFHLRRVERREKHYADNLHDIDFAGVDADSETTQCL